MMCRGLENTIYFASVNYAFRHQDSATSLIAPTGECVAYFPYGEEGVLIHEIDCSLATGLLASRYEASRYNEVTKERIRTVMGVWVAGEKIIAEPVREIS